MILYRNLCALIGFEAGISMNGSFMVSNNDRKWESSQIIRLAAEWKKLQELFPGVKILYPKDRMNAYVWLNGNTTSGIAYEFISPIPYDFPNSKPNLYLVNPNPLVAYDGKSHLNSLGSSHAFHMYNNGPNRCISICYTGHWHLGMTFTRVLSSGITWIQCYQIHTQTGETIDDILVRFKGREHELFNQR